jgi:hypothetical protein
MLRYTMKKKILPKSYFWCKVFHGKEGQCSGKLELYARFGRWMSSDMECDFKEDVFILPCLCFHFNHSELSIQFAWLDFKCWMFYKSWKREDYYRNKMLMEIRSKEKHDK